MKEIEYLEVAKRSTDMYSAQLEADNKLFLQTMNVKKSMEQEFEYEMSSLSKKHASELSAIDLKAKGKVHIYRYTYKHIYL
jgi:Glu-tRNA(Gln) amidotransferase subunit E-like FAD-binding protein